MDIQSLKQLEMTLWDTADNLRANSKLTSQQYCMPVLGLIFLRYAFGRFKRVEAEILKSRPVRKGRVMPVEPSDFKAKNALFLPREAHMIILSICRSILLPHILQRERSAPLLSFRKTAPPYRRPPKTGNR